MPTSSSLFGYSITNWGPLTTDFTFPASCTSATTIAIAYATEPNYPIWRDCRSQTNVCLPSPTDSGAVESAIDENLIPGDGQVLAFYSPGPSCPSGWNTVGLAARNAEGTLSRSGVFATATADEEVPTLYNFDYVLAALLDPSETALWCCPTSMTVAIDGLCYSEVPDYTISTACQTVYLQSDIGTFATGIPGDNGQTREGEILLITATTTGTVESTRFDASEVTDFVALSMAPPLRLVHQPTDLAGGEDSGENEDDSTEAEEEDPSETNAAARVSIGGGGAWGGVVVSLVASVVAGASLVLLR
ncbi:hypothetical protein BDW59DRAFT_166761 [Aspergillus cavernicola]|uniref:Uncharacterized protein n=1 Tax=Aspergillus cavernicola TaxID=176166 RepID=A0ABR4HJF2_9EURO